VRKNRQGIMIKIGMNQEIFEYDIYSLSKAFLPDEEIKLIYEPALSKANDIIIYFKTEIDGEFFVRVDILYSKNPIFEEEHVMPLEDLVHTKVLQKNALKNALYRALAFETKKELPWGTLTGIRPTKILMKELMKEPIINAQVVTKITQSFIDTYSVSENKAKLGVEIAVRERDILQTIDLEKGYSLYIGIPFCPTTCLYCSFTSYPIIRYKEKVEKYLEACEKEMQFVAKTYKNRNLNSVYIGGGTPTTLTASQLEWLLKRIMELFDMSSCKEFTVEAGRADSITKEKLEVIKRYGVTRISINPQTMRNETLKLIGRNHTVEEVKQVFHLAREMGFTNINMDLIVGLPGETDEDVLYTMNEVTKLDPDSVTVHSLAIKRASALHQLIQEKGIKVMHNSEATMEITEKAARKMQMMPYYLYRQKNMAGNFENVGYAKAGKFGIYNILIMEEVQSIVAIGAGTVSKIVFPNGRIERCDCVKDVDLYIERIEEMIQRKADMFIN